MHADPVASRSSLLGNQVLSLAAPSPAAASPHTPPQQLAAPDSHLSMRRSYGMSRGGVGRGGGGGVAWVG